MNPNIGIMERNAVYLCYEIRRGTQKVINTIIGTTLVPEATRHLREEKQLTYGTCATDWTIDRFGKPFFSIMFRMLQHLSTLLVMFFCYLFMELYEKKIYSACTIVLT